MNQQYSVLRIATSVDGGDAAAPALCEATWHNPKQAAV